MQFSTTKAQRVIVPLAERELTAAGFEVEKSDAAGGVLVASRQRGPRNAGAELVCNGSEANARETTFTIRLNALPGGESTVVEIRSTVVTSDAMGTALALRRASSTKECESAYLIENRLKDILDGR